MAVINPPPFLQSEDYDAADMRRLVSALVGERTGIVVAGDLAVTQNGTPNMSVNVATGRGVVAGGEATYQGSYMVDNQGTTNVTIAAANGSNPRYDRVVARVRDQEYSGSTNAWDLFVVQGTAAGVPSEPALSGNVLELARVTVGAGVTTITNANILDRRVSAVGPPPDQFLTLTQLSAGSSTSLADWSSHLNLLTAPYALTMVVTLHAAVGFPGADHEIGLELTDSANSSITVGTNWPSGSTEYRLHVETSKWAPAAFVGKKDFTLGQACGFKLRYKNVAAGTLNGHGAARVEFVPKTF